MSLVDTYTEHFQSYRHNVSDKARQYASGLMQAGSSINMDRMAEVVPEAKSRNLQQFLTHSKWNHRDVIDHVAQDVDKLLGDDRKACLLIDESGIEKQGRGSVGVSRQWLGRLGKVDNGQVAVFGALASGQYAAPIDVWLYLPEQWTDKESVEVGDVVSSLPARSWKTVTLRDTTRGALKVRICPLTVYVWDGESERAKCWTLIITKTLRGNQDTKISLTNAPEQTTLRRLGWMQRQRYWVERVFEDGKSECGMADYQVRKWSAWHHHMALVMMAMLFMLTEKIRHKDTYPLLSCSDIEELLAFSLVVT